MARPRLGFSFRVTVEHSYSEQKALPRLDLVSRNSTLGNGKHFDILISLNNNNQKLPPSV